MVHKLKEKKNFFPFVDQKNTNDSKEISNFLLSKDEALSPLNDNLDEIEIIEELQQLNLLEKMYELNSNVFFVSSRTTTDSDISNEQEIYNYIIILIKGLLFYLL